MLPKIATSDLQLDSERFLPELLVCFGIVFMVLVPLLGAVRPRNILIPGLALLGLGVVGLLLSETALAAYWYVPLLLIVAGALLCLPVLLRGLSGKAGHIHVGGLALAVCLGALGLSLDQAYFHTFLKGPQGAQMIYGAGQAGLLVYDYFTVYLRVFLYSFTALVVWLTLLTGIPDREDSPDFYCLLLGATLGMALMAQASHLLMIFIAIEMASLPSYALAGFLKGRRASSEAALKYVVYGGGAAGIMLYGISLLAGKFGTGYLPEVAAGIAATFIPGAAVPFDPIVVLGTVLLMVGIAFKLAAVPFHFWCPDVFEGASAEVAGFLSVASKGAALALLARVTLTLGGLDPLIDSAGQTVPFPYQAIIRYLVPALAFFAALTATFGNLAAYMQTNLKRLLAYSTIAHAGYMLMGLCTLTKAGVEAMLFYLIAYLVMNLGAFAVVAFLRNQTHSEDLADFRGLIRRSPVMVVTLSFFLLSLLGIPPLIGFAAKFQIFAVLYNDAQAYAASGTEAGRFLSATLLGLLVVGGLNTVLSAFYYIKVMKVMILDHRAEDLEGAAPTPVASSPGYNVYAIVMAVSLLALFVVADPLLGWSGRGAARFRAEAGKDPAVRAPAGAPQGMMMPMGGNAPGKPGKPGKGQGKGKPGKAKQ